MGAKGLGVTGLVVQGFGGLQTNGNYPLTFGGVLAGLSNITQTKLQAPKFLRSPAAWLEFLSFALGGLVPSPGNHRR